MIGKKYNSWTIISECSSRNIFGGILYVIKCDCGKEIIRLGTDVIMGKTIQCYACCIKSIGQDKFMYKRFGDRYVIDKIRKDETFKKNVLYYKTICDNDHVEDIRHYKLTNGSKDVCGKCSRPKLFNYKVEHHPLYITWTLMKQRCLNSNDKDYKYYGGRGIAIDPMWMDFSVFVEDMGERPEGMTLDRIDINLGYSPENVRWATSKEQANNRRTSKNHSNDYVGLKVGKWAVIKENGKNISGKTLWECICDCGTIKDQTSSVLNSRSSLQCRKCYMKQAPMFQTKR